MSQPNIHGVILAGGESRRMGQNKALLTVTESTLLAQQHSRLSQSKCSKILIASGPYSYPEYANCIADNTSAKGPLAGIISVCQADTNATGWLFLPVDMPNIYPQQIDQVITKGIESKRVVHFSNEHFPLYIPNHENIVQVLVKQVHTQNWSIRYFLSQTPTVTLSSLSQQCAFNTNTPAEWATYMRHHLASLPEETQYDIL